MAPKNDFMTRKMTKAKWKSRPIQSQIKDYHANAKIAIFCAFFSEYLSNSEPTNRHKTLKSGHIQIDAIGIEANSYEICTALCHV